MKTNKLRILLIEDSIDDRYLYKRYLLLETAEAGDVIECDNGEDGVALAEREQPDCVLLDYSLPGRDGIEVLKRLRSKSPGLPVVMLTGQGSETLAVRAIREGAYSYISKSDITPDVLKRTVRLAVEHGLLESRIKEQKQSLELFARALAHDLKEPVRTIRSFLDILESPTLTEPKRAEYKGYIREAADRMAAVIDSVYQLMRVDAITHDEAGECQADEALVVALSNLHAMIKEKKAVIAAEHLPSCAIKQEQLARVFQNLISNAIQYAGKTCHIKISCAQFSKYAVISIADDGPGIPAKFSDKLFVPFSKLGGGSANLGLGLSICKKIVESASGKLTFESNPGKGATFYIELPLAQTSGEDGDPRRADMRLPQDGDHAVASVLLVDDSLSDIELSRYALFEEQPFSCHFALATSGCEALRVLTERAEKSAPIDIVLLDINMPGMDGFETLRKIRGSRLFGGVPVIMCTTSSYGEDRNRAQELGASGYIVKPLSLENLRQAVDIIQGVRFDVATGDKMASLSKTA